MLFCRMKQLHQTEIEEMTKELEKKAVLKLNLTARRALAENTLLLRQVLFNNYLITAFSLVLKNCI